MTENPALIEYLAYRIANLPEGVDIGHWVILHDGNHVYLCLKDIFDWGISSLDWHNAMEISIALDYHAYSSLRASGASHEEAGAKMLATRKEYTERLTKEIMEQIDAQRKAQPELG